MSCGDHCETVSGTTEERWDALQRIFGANGETYADEYSDWQTWSAAHPSSSAVWETWLRWKYMYGTENYGNLPSFKKPEHVGNCYIPCPYSTQATDLRSTILLGGVPVGSLTKTNHTDTGSGKVHYMKPEAKLSAWGYECTFDDCPYNIVYGGRYFYI